MGRNPETLPAGIRISDRMGVGVVARTFPFSMVKRVLKKTRKSSIRRRDLPANVMIYYVIVNALYARTSSREVLRCLLEGLRWLVDPGIRVKVTGKSAISQARSRLGVEPVRRLHDEIVRPIARPGTTHAWYQRWRVVNLDTTTLAVGDDPSNVKTFGAGRNRHGKPQIRFVALVERGTQVAFGSQMGPSTTPEHVLAEEVLPNLRDGMLCVAGHQFFDLQLWTKARETGADLLWKSKKNLPIEPIVQLPDGSYVGQLFLSGGKEGQPQEGLPVRVLSGHADDDSANSGMLLTTILDHEDVDADSLIDLYRSRSCSRISFERLVGDSGSQAIVLKSKNPDLVRQEFYGVMMAHFAIHRLIHEAYERGMEIPGEIFQKAELEGDGFSSVACDADGDASG